jgi:hypothetical protein
MNAPLDLVLGLRFCLEDWFLLDKVDAKNCIQSHLTAIVSDLQPFFPNGFNLLRRSAAG